MNQRTYGYGVAARPGDISDSRDRFLVRTYNHLFGAIALFTLIEVGLFMSGLAEPLANVMFGLPWMLILGGFMIVGWLGSRAAHQAQSKPAQYAGLVGYTVAEALLFVPLLYIANRLAPGTIASAAGVTLAGFAGLTAIVFVTRKDFSFLGAFLRWAGLGALLLIGAGLLFGFELGTFFSVGMVVLAGASILYDTSNILLHFPEDRYVGAALQLFASVALMFWYVLRLFIGSRR